MNHGERLVDKVRLEFYSSAYRKQLESYCLPEEQLVYTDIPLNAIGKCELEKERYPVLVLSEEGTVGFFVLHGWEGVQAYSDNKKAILLRAYSMDQKHQGKGYAGRSLQLLPAFVREYFPERDEIVLAVNRSNAAAQKLYLKHGFIDKGVRAMGRKGELLVLHLGL